MHIRMRTVGGVLIYLSQYRWISTESMTHDSATPDLGPMVIFSAVGHHCPLTSTKSYRLVTDALAQCRYLTAELPRVEPSARIAGEVRG